MSPRSAVYQIKGGRPSLLRDVQTGAATSESFLGYENGAYFTGTAATTLKTGAFVSRLKSALGLPHMNMNGTCDSHSQAVLNRLTTSRVRLEFLERGDDPGNMHPHVTCE